MKTTNTKYRLWIRIGFVLVLILLGILMYIIGKEHTILVDNKDYENYKAASFMEVRVDGNKDDFLQLFARDRGQFTNTVVSQKHTITINVDGKDYTKTFSIPLEEKMILINGPAFIADAPIEVWLQPYHVATVSEAVAEEPIVTEEAGIPSDF